MVDLGNLVNADLWVVINVPLDILHEGICSSEFWPIMFVKAATNLVHCLLYTSPSPRDLSTSRMPSSA